MRTKTIETRRKESEKYLHIIHCPLSLSSLPHYQAEFYNIEKDLFSIFEFPIIHFVCPQILLKLLFSNALRDTAYSQEHLKTMVYAKFGGQTKCIMGNSKIENWRIYQDNPRYETEDYFSDLLFLEFGMV